ncbi:hypothetical protein R3P38DRAFT_3083443 [Favolaschia claudopus]|uniref:Ubiquitin-activating enzyme E1 1 n=1 Tax=Favolaschia claudopus TaxID=2862362 RepID=A0AAV9ZUX9_9AGAR
MKPNPSAIDEELYSRQLYALGHEAMKKIAACDVLIAGLQGLGAEIAKNIVLAGVKSVTVFDPETVTLQDLSSQFFLREGDIGKPRAEATIPRLSKLNPYVAVHDLGGEAGQELSVDRIRGFQVVVLCNASFTKQLEINDWTHKNGVAFIAAETRGLFGSIFNDFGPAFTCEDPTGEEELTGMIASINEEGLVTCLDGMKHGFEDGQLVTFSEVRGMVELNECKPRVVSVRGPYTFSIGDVSSFHPYQSGGIFTQVKTSKTLDFKSLRDSIRSPTFFTADTSKADRPTTLHSGFQALNEFYAQQQRLPRPRNVTDAEAVVSLAKAIDANIDEGLVTELAYQAQGDVPPVISIIGAFVASEVLKFCSSKFHPMVQHMYFDALESLPQGLPTESECQPLGTRYDAQIAVFGKSLFEKVANHRQFLVGCGGIGCEMLKNWGMMGVGSGPRGAIHLTDPDTIEKSNLNRQFLFGTKDLGKLKTEVASQALVEMNPDMKGKTAARTDAVGPTTEDVFDEVFFDGIDGVTNALDNISARLYMDTRCIFYEKPLLETGTFGTKGNVQVIIPYATESYASSRDPPEHPEQAPNCGLPLTIRDTVQWSRTKFHQLFVDPAQTVNQYLTEADFVDTLVKHTYSARAGAEIAQITQFLGSGKPATFEDCVVWARIEFETQFVNEIKQLLHALPKDTLTADGQPLWGRAMLLPHPLEFDADNEVHLEFIISAANLHAYNYGLPSKTDSATVRSLVQSVAVPEFIPRKETSKEDLSTLIAKLPPATEFAEGYRLIPAEFENDDDANNHLDFITAASNLRATNFGIAIAGRFKTKRIAGNIVPALVTTASLVAGLGSLELYKIIDGKNKPEDFKNAFINLALPFFGFSQPVAAEKKKHGSAEWTMPWDRFKFSDNPTMQHVVDWFKTTHNLDLGLVSHGTSVLWSSFFPKAKAEERLRMNFRDLVERVSKTRVPPNARRVVVEAIATDENDEDVDIPSIVVEIR